MDELRAAWSKLKSCVDDLAREREHYLGFFHQAADPYVVTDRAGRIVEVNGAAVDLFERRHAELKGKSLAVLVAPRARREFRLLELPAVRWQGAIHRRGGQRNVEFSGNPIPGRGACWLLRPLP